MNDVEALVAALSKAAGFEAAPAFQRLGHGMSGDVVVRLDGARQLFAKVGDPARRASVRELEREVGMLRWLHGRGGAPRLVWSGDVNGRPAMVADAIAGDALHLLAPAQAEAAAIAALAALTELHGLAIEDCPFDERLSVKLGEASRRFAAGEVDLSQLEAHNVGRPIAETWRDVQSRRPVQEDLVVTHGDACWPNLILRPDGGVGLIDLGRGGVADRHQDLALFMRSARSNFPDLPIDALVAAHYPAPVDVAKLEFYRELDEFF